MNHISLRPLTTADAPRLAHLGNDSLVSRYLSERFPYPYHPEDAIAFITKVRSGEAGIVLGIIVNGQLAGTIGLEDTDVPQVKRIGYFLGRDYWGRGIATQAVRLMVHKAFSEYGCRTLTAYTHAQNAASARVLEKNGFRQLPGPPSESCSCRTPGPLVGYQLHKEEIEA